MRAIISLIFVLGVLLSPAVRAEGMARETPVVKVIKEWAPSVVNISTERAIVLRTHPYWSQFGGAIGDQDNPNTFNIGTMSLKSIGSGVVISNDGMILTNAHVVQMASKIYVIMSDGKKAEAVIKAISPSDDLALIKIEPPENLRPMKIAKDAMLGETVVAVGNPLGLENSVSSGVISGISRNILINNQAVPALSGLIQTDAPINPGSSGGAIINLDGELVGVSLAVLNNANSISFVIPYNKIESVLRSYEEGRTSSVQDEQPVNRIKIKIQ